MSSENPKPEANAGDAQKDRKPDEGDEKKDKKPAEGEGKQEQKSAGNAKAGKKPSGPPWYKRPACSSGR